MLKKCIAAVDLLAIRKERKKNLMKSASCTTREDVLLPIVSMSTSATNVGSLGILHVTAGTQMMIGLLQKGTTEMDGIKAIEMKIVEPSS